MIAVMLSNKKPYPIVTELFSRGRKLNISLAFILQSYFAVPKDINLNFAHYFIKKIPYRRELNQILSQNLSDIDFQGFTNLYKRCTATPYSLFVIDNTLVADNPSRFRKNLIEKK